MAEETIIPNVPDPVLWSVNAILTLVFIPYFRYLYLKDKDKRKLMFLLAFMLAFCGLTRNAALSWMSFEITDQFFSWYSFPFAFAAFATTMASLLKRTRFSKGFNVFLFMLGISASALSMELVLGVRIPSEAPYIAVMAASHLTLGYLVLKRRQLPDVMFLLAQACYAATQFPGGQPVEFIALASFFCSIFTTLVFATSKYGTKDGIASVFALEQKLQKTEQELKEAQEQLLKAERLATIGELAAMIGHDLRNPLTGIAGASYYLKAKYSSKIDSKGKEMFEIIQNDVEYSNKIINDLLEYSREIRLELSDTTPKQIIETTLPLLDIPDRVTVMNFAQNTPVLKVDIEKLRRTFANIFKNAVEAMPEGGELKIVSEVACKQVKIVISDTGVGIPKETLNKLFLPLFTTKARGMGFGLAISRRFVDAHKGTISVESLVGNGTTFTIYLPFDNSVTRSIEPSVHHQVSSETVNTSRV